MSAKNRAYLQRHLDRGGCYLGQLRIGADFSLQHRDDAAAGLKAFTNAHDAIELARYDDAGKYRPLKTAPNLKHGWRLVLPDIDALLLALDFLYPAAIGTAREFEDLHLSPVSLRTTLERQSGMYAVVKKISDVQAGQVITSTCNKETGCLRRILWTISPGVLSPLTEEAFVISDEGREIPLLCAEACNLLVAAGRTAVKAAA